ncbi:hypothetical protein BUALT_Bualt10G0114900 [Buddleja alternifolia]|uniref:Uncharacterized protein n=1 Tax=Buddleja alternifolia TaxID=168488 RepID=A0AAV6WYL7_9LAMI|nr:hypothetical protein BUALT_Bualt10G0114900 [Buddleja alternifolia]
MILLWTTTVVPQARPPPCNPPILRCSSATFYQTSFLCASLGLISIGAGGIRSSSLAFGANQLEKEDDPENSGVSESYFSWYFATYTTSVFIALTCVVYVQDNMGWNVGFAVSAVLMMFGALSFFLASPFYVEVQSKTDFTGFFQVAVASYRNRHFKSSQDNAIVMYHYNKVPAPGFPSANLRFLNKACTVKDPQKDLTPDGKATGSMDPLHCGTSRGAQSITRSNPHMVYRNVNVRMYRPELVPTVIESIRRDKSQHSVQMSALWLVPQYCLNGFAEASNDIAQNEFYFSEFPRSMSSLASTLDGLGIAVGNLFASFITSIVDYMSRAGGCKSWISSDINEGCYDYYYLVLAGLGLVNMVYFLVCSRAYGPLKAERTLAEKEDEL